jgi:hypothetical protein
MQRWSMFGAEMAKSDRATVKAIKGTTLRDGHDHR